MSAIIGIITGLFVLFGANWMSGDSFVALMKPDAALIVFGGTTAALLVHADFSAIKNAFKHLSWLVKPPNTDAIKLIEEFQEWARIVRKDNSFLGLQEVAANISDRFLEISIESLLANTPGDEIRDLLYRVGDVEDREFLLSGEIWEAAGGYAPTIGVLGAVLGLIHVMLRLNHPSELGGGIATAFVATVYGVGSANLIFFPLGHRLKMIAGGRTVYREIATEGFLLLREKTNPRRIRSSLEQMLESRRRAALVEKEEKAQETPELATATGSSI
jgi:chemotaxis protein MotA